MTIYQGLQNKTVIVTGAAGGQGAEEARLLAVSGAHVLAIDLFDEPITPFNATTVTYRRLDVTNERDWAGLAADLRTLLGGELLGGLINNAGITHRARLGELSLHDWNHVLSVNVTGAMLGMQALRPLMGLGSSIVNVGSSAGLTAHYTAAYTTSKWALRGLTHVAATEYGPHGIRVNIIHPGFIETPMTSSAPHAMREAQVALTPLERLGTAEEVAHLAVFLLSDAATYISGAEIPVDGGFTGSGGAKYMADRIAAER